MQTRTAAGLGISIAAVGLTAMWLVRRRRRRMRMAEQQPAMLDPDDLPDVVIVEAIVEEQPVHDAGELYGVHVPPAEATSHPDDDEAQSYGENWLEAMSEDFAEAGPRPEQPVDILDEDDLVSPPSDTRDLPIADRGSAGPRGL